AKAGVAPHPTNPMIPTRTTSAQKSLPFCTIIPPFLLVATYETKTAPGAGFIPTNETLVRYLVLVPFFYCVVFYKGQRHLVYPVQGVFSAEIRGRDDQISPLAVAEKVELRPYSAFIVSRTHFGFSAPSFNFARAIATSDLNFSSAGFGLLPGLFCRSAS